MHVLHNAGYYNRLGSRQPSCTVAYKPCSLLESKNGPILMSLVQHEGILCACALARFSAVHREYKYFIVQRGDLDLAAMQEAAGHFVGDHDFRNFCKVDAQHVSSFRRTILDFRIVPVGLQGAAQVCALHVRGTAFLWHQVILLLVLAFAPS